MSDSVIFDQLSFVKRGVDVGVPREHAEWLAQEYTQLLEKNLATKTDIEQLRAATKTDIEQLRAATKTDIEQLRADTQKDMTALIANAQLKIVVWLSGVVLGTGALLIAILK